MKDERKKRRNRPTKPINAQEKKTQQQTDEKEKRRNKKPKKENQKKKEINNKTQTHTSSLVIPDCACLHGLRQAALKTTTVVTIGRCTLNAGSGYRNLKSPAPVYDGECWVGDNLTGVGT